MFLLGRVVEVAMLVAGCCSFYVGFRLPRWFLACVYRACIFGAGAGAGGSGVTAVRGVG